VYVFDTTSFLELSHYYPKRFPSLWASFNDLVEAGEIISVKEVFKEINDSKPELFEWIHTKKNIFCEPTEEEARFLMQIFQVRNFQHSLEQKKLIKGGAFADPFVIAKAKVTNGIVVTQEKLKPNAAKIPNICEHFKVRCLNFEIFMEEQNWRF